MSFIESYFSLAGVIWILSLLLVGGSSTALLCIYVLPLLHAFLIELLTYGLCGSLIYYAQFFEGHVPVLMAATGCIVFLLGAIQTCFYHLPKSGDSTHLMNIVSFICCVLWGGVGLYYESRLIGFLSVMAGFASLNFMVASTPFTTAIGFKNGESIPTAMMASLVLVGWYVYHKLQESTTLATRVFSSGCLFMGPLVFFIGCLIVSSKWYHKETGAYLACNLLTLVTLLACFFLGTIQGLENLYNFACIIGAMYVMDKYIEIPWGANTWLWGMLGAGLLLYSASFYAHILLDKMAAIEF